VHRPLFISGFPAPVRWARRGIVVSHIRASVEGDARAFSRVDHSAVEQQSPVGQQIDGPAESGNSKAMTSPSSIPNISWTVHGRTLQPRIELDLSLEQQSQRPLAVFLSRFRLAHGPLLGRISGAASLMMIDGMPTFIIPASSPMRISMPTRRRPRWATESEATAAPSRASPPELDGRDGAPALAQIVEHDRSTPSNRLTSISVISRFHLQARLAVAAQQHLQHRVDDARVHLQDGVASNGRIAMETMQEGEGRHCVNSRKEICSTETRLTMT